MSKSLVDSFGRVHTNLRISVTDRCNIRCFYCMSENVKFLPQKSILSFEEIERATRCFASLGINRIRLTGGEPLVRSQLPTLIRMIRQVDGIEEISITTNGILLARDAAALRDAGVSRLNVSLDTLDPKKFEQIARRKGLEKVLEGLAVARRVGFDLIRINAVAISGLSEPDILPLAEFSREHDLELRFIEFMPLDADQNWQTTDVLSGEKIRSIIESHLGKLIPRARPIASQPATDFAYADGRGSIGFIEPVSHPFCSNCDRLRLTAEGRIRNCLFSMEEWDLRDLMRSGVEDRAIIDMIGESVSKKRAGHGIDSETFVRPEKSMYQIGG